jgi:putative DNA primase/helicase
MESYEFEARVEEIKRRAHGRWTEILRTLGVDSKILNKRNQPCPLCGGTNRFQYTDKYGEGNYHCRGCGPGGGLKLLQGVCGWEFCTVLKRIEECVGSVPAPVRHRSTEPASDQMKKLAKRIWGEAKPVIAGDDVDRYLRNRGLFLSEYPKVLRFHSALGYYEKDDAGKSKKVAEYPAMLACIQGIDGHAVTLHRTYLQDGRKASNRDAKKVLSAGINGASVRLFDPAEELAITEGIETALAVHLSTGKPVWAAINAGNLEKLWIPETVRRICIYSDNDANAEYDGQACAFVLARRLTKESKKAGPRRVEVFVPKHAGTDWADVWRSRLENVKQAA